MKTDYSKKNKKNSRYIRELRGKPTRAEIILGKYLVERKIYFIYQKGFLVPFHRIADFYLPIRGIIIEVDGGYHDNIVAKDSFKDKKWKERGIKTIRIKNEEVYNDSFKEIINPYIAVPIEKDIKKHSSAKWYFY